jgi:hypothetical protein
MGSTTDSTVVVVPEHGALFPERCPVCGNAAERLLSMGLLALALTACTSSRGATELRNEEDVRKDASEHYYKLFKADLSNPDLNRDGIFTYGKGANYSVDGLYTQAWITDSLLIMYRIERDPGRRKEYEKAARQALEGTMKWQGETGGFNYTGPVTGCAPGQESYGAAMAVGGCGYVLACGHFTFKESDAALAGRCLAAAQKAAAFAFENLRCDPTFSAFEFEPGSRGKGPHFIVNYDAPMCEFMAMMFRITGEKKYYDKGVAIIDMGLSLILDVDGAHAKKDQWCYKIGYPSTHSWGYTVWDTWGLANAWHQLDMKDAERLAKLNRAWKYACENYLAPDGRFCNERGKGNDNGTCNFVCAAIAMERLEGGHKATAERRTAFDIAKVRGTYGRLAPALAFAAAGMEEPYPLAAGNGTMKQTEK